MFFILIINLQWLLSNLNIFKEHFSWDFVTHNDFLNNTQWYLASNPPHLSHLICMVFLSLLSYPFHSYMQKSNGIFIDLSLVPTYCVFAHSWMKDNSKKEMMLWLRILSCNYDCFWKPKQMWYIISWNLGKGTTLGTTLEINLVNMVPIHDNNGTSTVSNSMQFHRVNLRLNLFFSSVKLYPLLFSFPMYQFGLLLIGWSRRSWMKKLQRGVHDIHEQAAHHIITLPLKKLWDSIHQI